MKYLFIAKEKNTNDRDCVKYIEVSGFECGHYFGGIRICGACFSGFEKELREMVENNFEKLETILTRDEFLKLFELNDELKSLGYGIEKDSNRYNKGIELLNEINKIVEKLRSKENKELFEKVIADEKEYAKNEYNLSDLEVDDIFENYGLDYQDRGIIACIFRDFDEMVEEEKFSFGYDKQPYFDDESFGNDLLDSAEYQILDSGKIVLYNY